MKSRILSLCVMSRIQASFSETEHLENSGEFFYLKERGIFKGKISEIKRDIRHWRKYPKLKLFHINGKRILESEKQIRVTCQDPWSVNQTHN